MTFSRRPSCNRIDDRDLRAALDAFAAAQRQAELKLSYVSITAPLSGTVGARSLRVGQYVQAGTPLMAVVPLTAAYVVANYKETQLSCVAPGQPVSITVDSFPGVPLRGRAGELHPRGARLRSG